MGRMEQALIAAARPYMVQQMVRQRIEREIVKGCSPDLSEEPVALEPVYIPINQYKDLAQSDAQSTAIPEPPPDPDNLVRYQLWIHPDQDLDWRRSEIFLKQIGDAQRRLAFEVFGNREAIVVTLLCHRCDEPLLATAFAGVFDKCRLAPLPQHPMAGLPPEAWTRAVFRDCDPPPPYSHLLTRPEELAASPFETLITALSRIPKTAFGLYQAVFQPTHRANNWHRNVEVLLDFEYAVKLMSSGAVPQRYLQQAPSGDERHMAMDVERKAHSDKPFFAMALRIAVFCADGAEGDPRDLLPALRVFCGVFQHGGRKLEFVGEDQYAFLSKPGQTRDMFLSALTYRPGFIVNSWELTGPVHVPPGSILERSEISMDKLEPLPVSERLTLEGTPIGYCEYAGVKVLVYIPPYERRHNTHLMGAPGMGKSNLMERMILHDIRRGASVIVLDPHGDMVNRLLCLIPEEKAGKVIHLDFGDSEWIPVWNPLVRIRGQDLSRTADNLVASVKSVVQAWGDRLEYLLGNCVHAALHLDGASLLDVWQLLRTKSEESERLRERALTRWRTKRSASSSRPT